MEAGPLSEQQDDATDFLNQLLEQNEQNLQTEKHCRFEIDRQMLKKTDGLFSKAHLVQIIKKNCKPAKKVPAEISGMRADGVWRDGKRARIENSRLLVETRCKELVDDGPPQYRITQKYNLQIEDKDEKALNMVHKGEVLLHYSQYKNPFKIFHNIWAIVMLFCMCSSLILWAVLYKQRKDELADCHNKRYRSLHFLLCRSLV